MSDREELIRRRAYEIWEREGQPEGRDQDHWDQAVKEIDAEASSGDAPSIAAELGEAETAAPASPPSNGDRSVVTSTPARGEQGAASGGRPRPEAALAAGAASATKKPARGARPRPSTN